MTLRVEPFQREMVPEASRMLARAFVANPLHVAAFGASQLRRNEAFFRTGLAVMKGQKFVAVGRPGYLETDRPQNVTFYRRFGFETVAEIRMLGVSNYSMWRN